MNLIAGPLAANCYILDDSGELAVIDPGGEAELIMEKAARLGGDVKYIILTHYHFDHVDAAMELKDLLGGEILIHEAEKNHIKIPIDRYVRDGDVIKIGSVNLSVINTPGHSQGSICLLGDNFIFTGDTLFADGYGRTDLAGGSDEEMERSLTMLAEIIKPGMKVYPGHGEVFLGR